MPEGEPAVLDLGLRGTRHLCEFVRGHKLRFAPEAKARLPEATLPLPPQRVAIAGAGLAGLASAYLLERSGCDVTVFEARGRPGGRVHTLRAGFRDGAIVEAGATRVSDLHRHTMSWLKHFGLTVEPMYPARGRLVFEERGGLRRGRSCAGLSLNFVNQLVAGVEPWDRQFQGFVPHARRLVSQSLLKPGWYRVRGGTDRLPAAIAAALRGRIRYRTPVEEVEQDRDGALVSVRARGAVSRARFDRFVLATPATTMGAIRFAPPLSAPKRRAASIARAQSAVRVYFQLAGRGPIGRGLNGYGRTHDGVEIWQPTFRSAARQPVVVFYAQGDAAAPFVPLSPAERIASFEERLERLFPGAGRACVLRGQFCWDDEPWSRGAQSLLEYVPDLALADLQAPEGRIHFAGEHTSDGWMDGTLASAERVAGEIQQRSERLAGAKPATRP